MLLAVAAVPAQAAAVPIRWPTFIQQQFKSLPPAMFGAFADRVAPMAVQPPRTAAPRMRTNRKQRAPGGSSRTLAAAVGSTRSAEHEAFMLQQVQEAVAAVLGSADIDPQQPLMAAGLDSLSSVELRNSLEGKLGLELPTTLVFDYPTMAALAGFLASKIQPGASAVAKAPDTSSDSGDDSDGAGMTHDVVPRISRSRSPDTSHKRRRRHHAPPRATGLGDAPASPKSHRAFMLQQVQEAVAAVLGSADIDPQQLLMAAGLDSLSSVELRNSLEGKLGLELPTTLVFDYPTMAALAGFLASKIQPAAGTATEAALEDGSSSEVAASEDSEDSAPPQAPRRRRRKATSCRAAHIAVGAGQQAAMSPRSHQALMLQQVQDAVAAVLGSADIDSQQPLMAAGLDSLSSVELRNSLEGKLGLELPTTLVFDYPTMAAMAGFLASKVQPGAGLSELAAAADSASETDTYSRSDASYSWDEEAAGCTQPAGVVLPVHHARKVVAVTGMVVRAPADAFASIRPLDAVQMVPASRWDLEAHVGV